MIALGLVAQDGEAGFHIWRLNVGDETPAETSAETIFQRWDGVRSAVRGDNDLLVGAV